MKTYDVAIIGAGPGGYVAAIKAAQLGLTCALVERNLVGGTCLNRGCIPTKTILHTAELAHEATQAHNIGLDIEQCSIDYEALRTHKNEVAAHLRSGIEALIAANGIELLRGNGEIIEPGHFVVHKPGGGIGEYRAKAIIVAVGSTPARPPIEGTSLPGVYNSNTMLEKIPQLNSLIVIGGGVIGTEFAGVYTNLGAKVCVLELAGRMLSTMDREFGQSLAAEMRKQGGTSYTSAKVSAIKRADGGLLRVEFEARGHLQAVEAEAVLVAAGRRACIDRLFPAGLTPEMNHGRIVVNEHLQTSIEGIYAIGDAADAGIQLAHAASAQGIAAVCHIAGVPCDVQLGLIPSCVYTSPEIASVGLTEAEAKEQGISVQVAKFPMASNSKSVITGQGRSYVKILADEEGRIVGAHMLCGRATDMIGELSVAVACKLTAQDLARVVRPHPTFEEGIGEAVEALLGGSIHAMPKRRPAKHPA